MIKNKLYKEIITIYINMGYYLIAGFGAIVTGIGYFLIYKPETASIVISNITWELTKFVSNVSENLGIDLNNDKKDYNSDLEEEYEECSDEQIDNNDEVINIRNTFIKYYNFSNKGSFNIPMIDKESIMDEKKDMDVIFLKTRIGNEILYNRIEKENLDNLTEIKFSKADKQFLQVELINKEKQNEVLDIHNNLDKFYVIGNKILDSDFLHWYLSYFYKKELPEEYEIRIFDKDVNLIKLTKGEGIIISKDSYNKL